MSRSWSSLLSVPTIFTPNVNGQTWRVKRGCALHLYPLLSWIFVLFYLYEVAEITHVQHRDLCAVIRDSWLGNALLHVEVKKKKKCYNRLKSPLTVSFCSCLLLWFHLSPLCLFSCVRLPLLSGCTDHFHYRKCPSGRICMPSWALFSCL